MTSTWHDTNDVPPHGARDQDQHDFVDHVLEIVRAIPSGRVMTYGDVAATLGSRAARAVGQIMARYGSDVPWWRVIRASGQPPIGHEHRALTFYRAEGTPLKGSGDDYRVNLSTARYRP
ncbi:MAG: MGMT family protein [Acidimicrobiales bacterium]|jgi:alkylated DNA nucleotide flippase Atl1